MVSSDSSIPDNWNSDDLSHNSVGLDGHSNRVSVDLGPSVILGNTDPPSVPVSSRVSLGLVRSIRPSVSLGNVSSRSGVPSVGACIGPLLSSGSSSGSSLCLLSPGNHNSIFSAALLLNIFNDGVGDSVAGHNRFQRL